MMFATFCLGTDNANVIYQALEMKETDKVGKN